MIEAYIKYILEKISYLPFHIEIILIMLGFYFLLLFLSIIFISFVGFKQSDLQKQTLLNLERKILRLKSSYETGDISDIEYKNRVQQLKINIEI